ncbi:MAG TPA: HNH endonuclease [Chloroflexus aurantiacus]|uniref:HNH endonuclease n=1 Tax=Chloroflexus aurantiacus (strain ATCC 29366 / DSM 635 / J-10-fl) TaxID=324602 RepID=A9WFF5_CHLAA|nr:MULTISPECIES: hypothetical protein [Chloroflexus]ABY33893.1 conserved hypothetical protein [Chloroflexus aurantiacus J-10-fl]RMG49839.1 MAG: HNH endonuclease [Chloroflexota bacterium]HBW65623.1 HNH endonuclease [Chloroflexus aurantiacus]
MNLRLVIELVPSTSWYANMRKVLPRKVWDNIRKSVYAEYGHRCGICGATGRLECHERWEYDDEKHIQTLRGFIALCPLCHRVKHIGLAGIHAAKGIVDYEKVAQHFMNVNRCDRDTFEQHKKQAFAQWRQRSRYQWQIDFGPYQSIVEGAGSSKAPRPSESM